MPDSGTHRRSCATGEIVGVARRDEPGSTVLAAREGDEGAASHDTGRRVVHRRARDCRREGGAGHPHRGFGSLVATGVIIPTLLLTQGGVLRHYAVVSVSTARGGARM